MEQISSPATINEINAVLLSQYQATKKPRDAGGAALAPSASFVAALNAVKKSEATLPVSLTAPETAVKAQALAPAELAAPASSPVGSVTTQKQPATPSATATEITKAEEKCTSVKISRSPSMECAERATKVSYEDDDFGFDDLVDLINPLQHIPVIGAIYREITGDQIKPEVQIAGSIAYGAVTGSLLLSAATGIASAIFEQHTGQEPTVMVADALFGSDEVQVSSSLTEDEIVLADAPQARAVAVMPSVLQSAASGTTIKDRAALLVAQTTIKPPASIKADVAQSVQGELPSTLAATMGGLRIGNVIYPKGVAHKIPMTSKVAQATSVLTDSNHKMALAQTRPTTEATIAADPSKPKTNKTLGDMIYEQAKVHESGQQLPPELIQDMMLKALDKYQAAALTGESTLR